MNPFRSLGTVELTEHLGEAFVEQLESILSLTDLKAFESLQMTRRYLLASVSTALFSHKYASPASILKLANEYGIENLAQQYSETLSSPNIVYEPTYILRQDTNFLNFVARKADLLLSFDELHSAKEQESETIVRRPMVPFRPLKDYQMEVFGKTIDILEQRYAKFIIHMPTGSGKTRTAAEVICHFLNNNPASTVVWIAHSVELCDQAFETLIDTWQHLGTRDIRACRFYDGHADAALSKKQHIDFLCASFQTLYSKILRLDDLNKFVCGDLKLVIVDEAHKVTAPTYEMVTRKFLQQDFRLIGLTATPGKSFAQQESDEKNAELSDFFNNEYLTFNCGDEGPIQYLQNRSILAKATMSVLNIDSNIELSSSELKSISQNFDLPEGLLKKIGKNQIRNSEIFQRLKDLVADGRNSILYFATSLEQSKLICALLHLAGIGAAHVDGSCPSPYRRYVINQFRVGKIQILCNYQVLTTGFDAPKIDCVFIARPTSSVVLYSQMIGRGLRGPQLGGLPTCDIITVRDNFVNLPEANNIFNIFQEYWN